MGIINYSTFIATATFFIMTPGIDTMFVLKKSIGEGKRSGMYSTLGINSGIILHTILAAIGLSSMLIKYPMAFEVIKYLGAIYIIFMGFSSIISKEPMISLESNSSKSSSKNNSFINGLITNILNPKNAMFFLALFPQFINQENLKDPFPFFQLGLTYALIGCIWYSLLTLFAGTFSTKIKESPNADRWLKKLSGIVFIVLGLQLATGY
ncbi:LysE family translocator [Echinicola shivajiensis]|uniref:LysE family translocator n=1 Tax=Echinicola shivajiensis TaxID=1035916 RepID=UPI001BFC0B67|nr:LysE family translocator [Echinicola shivajiensis]